MSTVTGNARMFTGNAFINNQSFELIFTPSGPSVGTSFTFWGPPIAVKPEFPTGAFSASLVNNSQMTPKTWYTVSARWLDPNAFGPDQGFIGVDFPGWDLYVTGDGDMKDMLHVPDDAGSIWIGPTAPQNPGDYTAWIDNSEPVPATGMPYYEWE